MNIEEIKQAYTEADEATKGKLIEFVAETGEGKELLNNFAQTQASTFAGKATTELQESIFAVAKEKGLDVKAENITDFATSLIEANIELSSKDDSDKVKALNKKIDELEKNGGDATHFKAMWEGATKALQEAKQLHSDELSNLNGQFQQKQIESEFEKSIAGVKLQDMPDVAKEAIISSVKAEVLKRATIKDGVTIHKDEDGNQIMTKDFSRVATTQEVVNERLKDVMADGSGSSGGNSKRTIEKGSIKITTGADGKETKSLVLSTSSFSNETEFNARVDEALKSEGIATGTIEAIQLRAKARKEYGFANK